MKKIPAHKKKLKSKREEKKRKRPHHDYALIGMILIVIAIILYSFFTSPQTEELRNTKIEIIPPTQENTTNDSIENSEEYLLGVAISQKNITMCAELQNKSQECFVALAAFLDDACLLVEDYEQKKSCIHEFVLQKNSPALCLELNEEDIHECGLLVDPCYGVEGDEKNLCLALEYADYSRCESDECLMEYAVTLKDIEACDNIYDSATKTFACYSAAQNQDRCDELPLTIQQDVCYNMFADLKQDIYYCLKINTDSVYRYECNLRFALSEENPKHCNNIDGLTDRWSCYREYSLTTGDVTGCDSIDPEATANYEQCYFNFAIEHIHPMYCEKLEGIASEDSCYAQAIMDPYRPLPVEECHDVMDSQWTSVCYKFSAEKNDDPTICEFIQTENKRLSCLDQFKPEN